MQNKNHQKSKLGKIQIDNFLKRKHGLIIKVCLFNLTRIERNQNQSHDLLVIHIGMEIYICIYNTFKWQH